MVSKVKREIIIVDDPGEDGILRKVVVGPVGGDVDEVEVLDVGDFTIRPHVHYILQLHVH